MKKIIIILLIVLFSCNYNIDIDEVLLNTEKDLIVTTFGLPNEPSSSTSGYSREIVIYSSYEDMVNRLNPIDSIKADKAFYGQSRTVIFENITSETIYIRILSWYYVFYSNNTGYFSTSYYYNQNVVIPKYNSKIIVNIQENKLIEEK